MIRMAKAKNLSHTEFVVGDCEHLPFAEESFDAVICSNSFHHYPNPKNAVMEFYKVLRNGGTLLLADYWKPFPMRQLMNIFIPFSNEGDVKIYSQNEIVNFLTNCKFKNIKYQKVNNSSYLVTAKKQQ